MMLKGPKYFSESFFEGLVLPYMTCKDMVMFEWRDFESEVRDIWHEYSVTQGARKNTIQKNILKIS